MHAKKNHIGTQHQKATPCQLSSSHSNFSGSPYSAGDHLSQKNFRTQNHLPHRKCLRCHAHVQHKMASLLRNNMFQHSMSKNIHTYFVHDVLSSTNKSRPWPSGFPSNQNMFHPSMWSLLSPLYVSQKKVSAQNQAQVLHPAIPTEKNKVTVRISMKLVGI